MTPKNNLIAAAGLGFALAAGASATAQDYPEGTITAIVPFSPGGTSDSLARIFANELDDRLGRTFIVDNRPGASGNIGIAATANAAADGLTVLFTSSGIVWNPALFNNLPFDPVEGIQPVALLASSPQVIAVNAEKFPDQSLGEVIDYIHAHPGEVNLAASGIGLVERDFAVKKDADVAIIPYNGSADSVTAVLGGEVDIVMGSALNVVPVLDTGKIRAIAIAGDERMDALPGVPTTEEAGHPDLQISFMFGAFLPGGTPEAVVQTLHDALNEIAAMPEVTAQIRTLGWAPRSMSVEEFETFYAAELANWAKVVEKAGIQKLD